MHVIEISKKDPLYPNRLKQIKHPPQKLYVVGNVQLLQTDLAIAVVGSRDCSYYGQAVGFEFARELAKRGITIVSGLALGIDTIAHTAALHKKGNTIAVLGSGFDHIFPKENEELFYKILEQGGCIISEYPPEEEQQPSNFPKRNRIMVGLASKVLVVEAKKKSGSLITARLAKEEGKEVFALPSDLGKKEGAGTNELILKGASFVTQPDQIITKMIEERMNVVEIQQRKVQSIPTEYQEVYALLQKENKHINEISKLLNIPLSEVSQTIMLMELEGYIEKTQQNQYQIRR